MSELDDKPWWDEKTTKDPVLKALMDGLAAADEGSRAAYLKSLSKPAYDKLMTFLLESIDEILGSDLN